MSYLPRVLTAFGRLFEYPDEHTSEYAELLFVVLQHEAPEAASCISRFGAYIEQHAMTELEELYSSTFEVNPACPAEVGWHLFGEEYSRGLFLVRMRQELKKYGLEESIELPDHLTHALAVTAAMPDSEAVRFVKACLQPAVEKMSTTIEGKRTEYEHVLHALRIVLDHAWGPRPVSEEEDFRNRVPFARDPLRDYQVADVGSNCGTGCTTPGDLIQLDVSKKQV